MINQSIIETPLVQEDIPLFENIAEPSSNAIILKPLKPAVVVAKKNSENKNSEHNKKPAIKKPLASTVTNKQSALPSATTNANAPIAKIANAVVATQKTSNNSSKQNIAGSLNAMNEKGDEAGVEMDEEKDLAKAALLDAITAIREKIVQYWFVPEEYLSRKDLVIKVAIHLSADGYITSFKLTNSRNSEDYKAVAKSVMKTLSDKRLFPLPMDGMSVRYFILSFAPHDLH